ncbi:MAG: hypothetical protein ACE5H9_21520 [Anaerolineae bacterium]
MGSFRVLNTYGKQIGLPFVALVLAVVALALALSINPSNPVEAQAVARRAGLGEAILRPSDIPTTVAYLPLVSRSDVIFFDDFSDSNSGWPSGSDGERCSFGYHEGHYRIRLTTDQEHCIVAAFPAPKQLSGTFSFKVRRTSDSNRDVQYGFLFGAGSNAFKDRWMLEVRADAVCDGKGYFWLSYLESNSGTLVKNRCTDAIETDNDWNDITVVRFVDQGNSNNDFIKIYINGLLKGDYNGDDDDIAHLRDLDDFGFFDLVALAFDNNTSTSKPLDVEFDDFTISTSTATP